jgi:hypothetical protein
MAGAEINQRRSSVSLVSQSIPELQVDAGELQIVRHRLVAEKRALEAQLAEVNAKCERRLPQQEYQKLRQQRAQIIRQMTEKEAEIADLNSRRAEVNTVLNVRTQKAFTVPEIRQLVEIRDRWHGFSMDAGNHQKAREAAWQFSQELRALLKTHFDGALS